MAVWLVRAAPLYQAPHMTTFPLYPCNYLTFPRVYVSYRLSHEYQAIQLIDHLSEPTLA